MPSGLRSIVINTAERAISDDINRAQALSARGLLEYLRFAFDVGMGTDDTQAGSFSIENVSLGAPMRGEIIGGLCPIPQNGALGLGITGGLLLAVDPDAQASPDDSVYKYVKDPGGVAGSPGWTLAMTANGGGQPRIDVVECQPVPDPNPEEDSRDVFNPLTGLFTASTLQKTLGATLTYRVRLGTVGSGYPGVALGWMPLAVASVPAGATTCDQMTFWDVRPLVNDRIFGGTATGVDLPRRTKLDFSQFANVPTIFQTAGVVEVNGGQRRLGGQLRRGSPGVDLGAPYVNFMDVANQEKGLTLTGVDPALLFFYLLTPFGLPRWARYTDVGAGLRHPRNPRGIPIVSKVHPSHVYGIALSPIALPDAYGFGTSGPYASTQEAVCFGATTFATIGGTGTVLNHVTSEGWTTLTAPVPLVSGTSASTSGQFSISENTHFPAGSTRLRVKLEVFLNIVAGAAAIGSLTPTLATGINPNERFSLTSLDDRAVYVDAAVSAQTFTWVADVSLPNDYPDIGVENPVYVVKYELNAILPAGATFAVVPPRLTVLGFKYE